MKGLESTHREAGFCAFTAEMESIGDFAFRLIVRVLQSGLRSCLWMLNSFRAGCQEAANGWEESMLGESVEFDVCASRERECSGLVPRDYALTTISHVVYAKPGHRGVLAWC